MAPLYAHEINNLITQLSGRAQLALMQIENEAVVTQALRGIVDGCERAARLSELFLTPGTLPAEDKQTDSLPLIVDRLRTAIPQCEQAQGLLHFDIDDDDPTPGIPPIVLEQILDNLIRNALRAIDEHPDPSSTHHEIRIACDPSPRCSTWNTTDQLLMRIVVSDTGVGMTAAQVESLFALKDNHRSAGPRNERYPRHGLGMRVCRMLIESVGGAIHCDSKPNQGTRMTLLVPTLGQETESYRSAA